MSLSILIHGIIRGFMIGAVVGPIGILCVQRSITYGFSIGLATGIGAALADAIYGAIAAFGLSAVQNFLLIYAIPLRIIGGSYLLYLGYKAFTTKPISQTHAIDNTTTITQSISSTFFLTITNPVTIVAFLSIFAAANLENIVQNYIAASILTIGVFIGSTIWWILLSGLSTYLRTKLNTTILSYINRFSGIIITIFALQVFFDAIQLLYT